jgi:hypothetical protein
MTALFRVTSEKPTRFTTLQLFNFIQFRKVRPSYSGVSRLWGEAVRRAPHDSNLGRFSLLGAVPLGRLTDNSHRPSRH